MAHQKMKLTHLALHSTQQSQKQAQQAPFSFHCRICYERLNLTDRPPVVLPCGHTYICLVCSQKLTRCMECRTRIVPPKKILPHQANKPQHYRPYAPHNRQLPVPTTVDELASVIKATAVEELPILPKNVVLMSLIEAAEQKTVFRAGHNTSVDSDEKGYESGDDDELVIEGLSTLNSSFGTYVVKAKEGLWVYSSKPPPAVVTTSNQDVNDSSFGSDPPGMTADDIPNTSTTATAKENQEPTPVKRHKHSFGGLSRRSKERKNGKSKSSEAASEHQKHTDSARFQLLSHHKHHKKALAAPKPIELLPHGSSCQVVCFVDNVAQLARGGGYIRVERDDELVKVGEPTDEACRIEGLIFSISDERRLYKQRISELSKLEKTMQSNLRHYYKREAEEQEEAQRQQEKIHRQQAMLEKEMEEAQQELIVEHKETGRITPPSSPPQLLEMSPSSTTSGQETTASASASAPQYHYDMSEDRKYSNIGGNSSRGNPRTNNMPNYRPGSRPDPIKEKKDSNNKVLSWEEELINQGCDLFWCATMPLCVGSTPLQTNSNQDGIDQSASIVTTGATNASSTFRGQSHNSTISLDRNESYGNASYNSNSIVGDNSTVASGGVDFRSGFSGHRALNVSSSKKQSRVTPRKEVRMMSQHDGIAHIRRAKQHNGCNDNYSNQNNTSGVFSSGVSVGGNSKASIATL